MKTYSELIKLKTFEERLEYLIKANKIGDPTFGGNRYVNQIFYKSPIWKATRDKIIIRDHGCDLGIEGLEIYDRILIHHINPIDYDDLLEMNPNVLDPENLITTSFDTHNLIHYGSFEKVSTLDGMRRPNDTIPWR